MDVTTAENERAMDQGASYGSGSNRMSDNFVLFIFISKMIPFFKIITGECNLKELHEYKNNYKGGFKEVLMS